MGSFPDTHTAGMGEIVREVSRKGYKITRGICICITRTSTILGESKTRHRGA